MIHISLKSKVARTATQQEERLNRLRIGEFSILSLGLRAGEQRSRSYTQPSCSRSAPDSLEAGSDEFHFAPEVERTEITYTLDDRFSLIEGGRLELFTRFRKEPLWSRELQPHELTHGDHRLEWNGRTTQTPELPDGYVTVEFSPYKLKLTLRGRGLANPPVAWTYFHVLVADIKLQLGDRRVLSEKRDRALHDTLYHQLPEPGKKAEVRLVSNLFMQSITETYDDSAAEEHARAWGDGPNLPIFARVTIRDSKDQEVAAPKALGAVRFLWDWEDVPEDTSHQHPRVSGFLGSALDYKRRVTEPPGDNCHQVYGGKRGAPSSPLFPPQAGYEPAEMLIDGRFPFKVEPCHIRQWAALSQAWTSGALAGYTGVLFQPSRMAGDAYRLTVCLASDRNQDGTLVLDTKAVPPLPAAIARSTGIFEIWRSVHITRYIKKKSTLPDLSIPKVQSSYKGAFIRLTDQRAAHAEDMSKDYNTRFSNALGLLDEHIRLAIDPDVDQFAIGKHAVTFRSFSDYKRAIKAWLKTDDRGLDAWLKTTGKGSGTSDKYHRMCKRWAQEIVTRLCEGYLDEQEGINIFQFSGLYSHEARPGGIQIAGFTPTLSIPGRERCAFVQCASSYGDSKNTMEQTLAHEIGHLLFLPHAPPAVEVDGELYPDDAHAAMHDKDWEHCMMSYNYSSERMFCGFCLLRLRGWRTGSEQHPLKNDARLNRQP